MAERALLFAVATALVLSSALFALAQDAADDKRHRGSALRAIALVGAPAVLIAAWSLPLLGAFALAVAWIAFSGAGYLLDDHGRDRAIARLALRAVGLAPIAFAAITAGLAGSNPGPAIAAGVLLAAALGGVVELAARLRAPFSIAIDRDVVSRRLGTRVSGLLLAGLLAIAMFLTVLASIGLGTSPLWLAAPCAAALVGFFAALFFSENPTGPGAETARAAARVFTGLALFCLGPGPLLARTLSG
jgi:hypothetical protein